MNDIVELMNERGWVCLSDNKEQTTLTFQGPLEAAGHAIKCESGTGQVWYGKVDKDGIALLTRSDLLPKKGEI
ncbi:hypothetical protein JQX09_17970 [Sulfitobacter pseudonitzschiae]|uniref:Uncharacterized protein n=1 Tax=Pseudosulfitobacter pseudonitzschiae TaxID=1402135 RepID=A0A9Q2P3P2_9RHOB|nr:hypothetical protein [Pseudosulfitobacter pseudonitzschiae]MBM2293819.1 hypothetical protein [Pseudosulfitobacter pseudonitzschiae]MBM2298736.1 hypothetical protein [Pseudosulfitobacter pseudonitzschiae]MBM2303651.1 hypothetical protein [Pseudosulfitobacter pseudonitzschiae]MBM2313433.1 hypothetical protein [Pseudosulfitobacter pseudonitzschiae]MBM2318347.1 hypothetical protein [Pseudosulfitobacter pseudonitzschiae]